MPPRPKSGGKLVEQVRDQLVKQFGDSIGMLSEDAIRSGPQTVIPTGIDVIDHYLVPIGGFPAGLRGMVELFGTELSGKSSLLYALLAQVQRMGGVASLADTEQSGDSDRMTTFGVDPGALLSLEPDHLEHLLEMIPATLRSFPGTVPCLIGWDSLAATATKNEVDGEKITWDGRAKTISQGLRLIGQLLVPAQTCLCVNNQPRSKIGIAFGNPVTTPGGQALKSHASLRIEMYGGKVVEVNGTPVGRFITAAVRKTRFGMARKVKLRLDNDGWNNEWCTLNLAKELDLVPAQARGAKALADALFHLGRHFPGFASITPVDNGKAERADEGTQGAGVIHRGEEPPEDDE